MTTTLRPGSPEEVCMLPARVAYARDLCAGWVRNGHTPALSVCVARRGVVVLHEAWGVLGPEPGAPPLALDSIFPMCSLTKPITATLVMQLVEDGLLGLNRPVVDYLPEITGEGAGEILVHHLLTHTSGYPWGLPFDEATVRHVASRTKGGFEPPPCPPWRHPENHFLLSLHWDTPRVAAPGEVMIYSNHNYLLLGEIVTRLTERPIEELARERVFAPLGMDSSSYVVPESDRHRAVRRASGLPLADPIPAMLWPGVGSPEHQATPNPGGGVFSTPYDMTVFGQMILNRGRYGDARILSPAAVAAMTRNQIPGVHARLVNLEAEHASWGYGWAVTSPTKWKYFDGSLQPLGTLCHPGAGGVAFWIDPELALVGAYFEVTTRITERYEQVWNFDLFQNAITAAVEE